LLRSKESKREHGVSTSKGRGKGEKRVRKRTNNCEQLFESKLERESGKKKDLFAEITIIF
jgi:hypothetical protein